MFFNSIPERNLSLQDPFKLFSMKECPCTKLYVCGLYFNHFSLGICIAVNTVTDIIQAVRFPYFNNALILLFVFIFNAVLG